MRIEVNNGRVKITNGVILPASYHRLSSSKPQEEELGKVEGKKEEILMGQGVNPELAMRLNLLDIKKSSTELQNRLRNLQGPKKKLISFTF
jgi:hypothetical protein